MIIFNLRFFSLKGNCTFHVVFREIDVSFAWLSTLTMTPLVAIKYVTPACWRMFIKFIFLQAPGELDVA